VQEPDPSPWFAHLGSRSTVAESDWTRRRASLHEGGTMGFMPFTARIELGRSAITIALSDELGMATAPILEEHLVRAESDGEPRRS
jgi:hypothetical protein